jgi:hypothetical protein
MYLPFDIVVICELLQDEENLEQDKSRKSVISYALRVLEYNRNASECLPLAEAPPTPDRLNDFGILKVPDQLSEVIYLNTVCFDNPYLFTLFCLLFLLFQVIRGVG